VLVEAEANGALSALPVGIGITKKIPESGLNVLRALWLQDGKRILVTGERKGDDHWQLFVLSLEGGAPTPVPNAAVTPDYLDVSPDDRLAAALGPDGTLTLYPLDGTAAIPLTDLGKLSKPSGWTTDGQLWATDSLTASRYAPSRLMRYDIRSRCVVEERTVSSTDLTGFLAYDDIFITPNGEAIAYESTRFIGSLFLLDGLVPPRR
jgi:hypothetical protein